MSIHDIVNANDLIGRCMDAVSENKRDDMVKVYKTKMAFDDYVGSGASDLECAKKVTKFIHRGKEKWTSSTYKGVKYGDNSTFSAYDVFSNVLEGESETGNCLGTSQVCAYLLMSRGIDVRLLKNDNHGLLEVKINEKWFPIETTTENGFDYVSKAKFKSYNISGLELEVLGYQALVLSEEEKYDLAIEKNMKAIKLNNKDSRFFNNLGVALSRKEKYDLAIENYTKAINLNKENPRLYKNRAIALFNEKEFGLAIKDAKKYASFAEENALRVEPFIKKLRCLLELEKNKKD